MTIAEAAAIRHGEGLPLPNVLMSSGGFQNGGTPGPAPDWARREVIEKPLSFSLLMHGTRAIPNLPDDPRVLRARRIRENLDDHSPVAQRFNRSLERARYLRARRENQPQLENANLIEKLMLRPSGSVPGVSESPLREVLLRHLPDLDIDPNQSQAALAVALAHFGVSAAVTLGTSLESRVVDGAFASAPLAFDYAHNAHRAGQASMWSTTFKVLHGLISALKQLDYLATRNSEKCGIAA